MAERVNLDALIPREDMDISQPNATGKRRDTVSVIDLQADSFFLPNLYKPDFQRETAEWDYIKIDRFIESFISSELIPSVILWQNKSGSIFVIDGAHRLSALIAWINDDYGDGIISQKVYNRNIPEEQLIVADKARKYIEKYIKPYSTYKRALLNPTSYEQKTLESARILSSAAIQLQWVEGDVSSAENSFFNINQQGAPINKTELKLIKSRKKPNCIAARAIMHSGLGHKYWSIFDAEHQLEIEQLAKEIFEIMFQPKLQMPIKTLDVPMCGKHNHNALPLIFDFVNICNSDKEYEDDQNGDNTISCLKQTRKIARLINSNHPSSLGLHPLVYFYAKNGSYKIASFYAFTLFVLQLDEQDQKGLFIKHRAEFEHLYYENNYIIQAITRKGRSAKNSMTNIKDFLFELLYKLESGAKPEEVIDTIRREAKYSYLPSDSSFSEEDNKEDFSSLQKSAIFIKNALQNAPRCKICGGLLHRNAISIDHINRKQDGGIAVIDNGQLTHPYCNTGYKN